MFGILLRIILYNLNNEMQYIIRLNNNGEPLCSHALTSLTLSLSLFPSLCLSVCLYFSLSLCLPLFVSTSLADFSPHFFHPHFQHSYSILLKVKIKCLCFCRHKVMNLGWMDMSPDVIKGSGSSVAINECIRKLCSLMQDPQQMVR